MTAPLRSTPHASAIAAISASQNTAPVAEFRCLFTQDIRRKQKRWQDGFLKFHTFNNRVMVYDQARNFLGDTYHKDSNELQEGDELNLNNGALVEVAEAMGITQTDLKPLFEKKTIDPPPARTAASQTRPFQRPSSVAPSNLQGKESQLRHKSLNTLLGTPKGPIGKAQPMRSPYEARKEKENEQVEDRKPKRLKTAHAPANWRASSPVQEESSVAKRDLPSWPRTADAKSMRRPAKFIPPSANIITIDSESDPHPSLLSDVAFPSTPPTVTRIRAERRTLQTSIPKPVLPDTPPVQTPKIPRGKVPVSSVKALETPKQAVPVSSPPVSASNRLTNVEFAIQPAKKPPKESFPAAASSPAPIRKPKSLRLSTGVKRGTLLCQALPQQTSRAGSEARASSAKMKTRKASHVTSKEPLPAIANDAELHQRDRASITKRESTMSKGKRKEVELGGEVAPKRVRVSKSPLEPSPDFFDDQELIHGCMDQQLLVSSSPTQPSKAPSPPAATVAKPKPAAAKKSASKDPTARKRNVAEPSELKPAKSISAPPKETTRKAQPRKKAVAKPPPASNISPPPAAPALEPPVPPSQDASPTHIETSDTRSRTESTSPSKIAFSTGGFPKKAKRKSKASAPRPILATPAPAPVPEASVPAKSTEDETVALPRLHPLRAGAGAGAGKKGPNPLMSTTELAALLQIPKSTKKALLDPIENDLVTSNTGKPSHRNIRRMRSENDAPIPSTAKDWEKCNLPKTSCTLTELSDPPAQILQTNKEPLKKKTTGLSALIRKTDPRRRFKLTRTQSLTVETNVGGGGMAEVELPSPVVDDDVGPWSTEAAWLFDWQPLDGSK
ncbi:hypothetical protein EJ02DRAFT_453886 [Clathrospora elynae]|uniref:5'-3' DNA helicase ZGRF1-like N-terminal domain-containing protein n=1 Tax=Clathrospora elynae TaxID=706981 RepID=A0A6A5SRS5_9PLEO|nr:hypothetical protein EJ02DRAFT_453886 [Clathrospora elynae]